MINCKYCKYKMNGECEQEEFMTAEEYDDYYVCGYPGCPYFSGVEED